LLYVHYLHLQTPTNHDYQVAAILPAITIVTLWVYLNKENKRRDQLESENQVNDTGVVETVDAEGTRTAHVVDNTQLDLTDRENLKLYVITRTLVSKHLLIENSRYVL
jgi:hypothetical protein